MRARLAVLLVLATVSQPASAQPATAARVEYTLRVDSADLSGISVDMRIRGAPAEFRVAMVAHTEYDDQYWRYLTELRGESLRGPVTVTREDSSLWRIAGAAGDITLRYRVRFPASPPMQQASWKAHLTAVGGLVGGPHSFLYVVGSEHAPVRVALVLPSSWQIATGLTPAAEPRTFTAPGAEALVDSPMLVGRFRSWQFEINGVPHRIAYLGQPAGTTFDTTRFVSEIERFARETARMFGHMPYRTYQFLFEDGTYGGLEHLNSVSIGTQSADLARDPHISIGQIAHEFFHTWNEVHVRPVSWIGVRHVAPAPTGELWFSEGVTLYFADLLLRRAGLYTYDSTRVSHLERLMSGYFANPSHAMVSAEHTSRAFNLQGATGDYTPSMFTQGELLGAMLDLMIRDGSGGRRSLDDVMRSLSAHFSPERGFTGADVESAVATGCACDARPFFDAHVRAASAIDFDRWLGLAGLRTVVTWAPASAADGTPAADLRMAAYSVPGERSPRLITVFPSTVWGKAGLHTGDQLVSWNGAAMSNSQELRTAISQLHIGDTVRVVVARNSTTFATTVAVTGYERPAVRVEERPDATERQRRLRTRWKSGR